MTKKIPPAKEFLEKYQDSNNWSIEGALIEFGRMCAQEALESAAKSEIATSEGIKNVFSPAYQSVILNAYSLDQIK